jgi:galactonate dehydratase
MRITDIEIIQVNVPYLERVREYLRLAWRMEKTPSVNTCIYKVHTDEGLVGLGEGTANLGDKVKTYLGRDPFDFIWDDSVGGTFQMACHDLMGKALGIPVYKLFGPKQRNEVLTMYWSHCFPPEIMAREAKIALESGFTCHKTKARPFHNPVEQIAAMAEVVPADYPIAVDANGTFEQASRAIQVAKEFTKYPNVWAMESPIPQSDIDGYRLLKREVNYPIAIHSNQPPPLEAVKAGMCDYFVIEFEWASTLLKQAAIAEAAGVNLWVENGLYSGISAMFQTHQAAAIKNADLCISLIFLMEDDLIIEPFAVKNGHVEVPEKPGIGVTLDEDAVDNYRI